jgi:excisionase family DNA binding protein
MLKETFPTPEGRRGGPDRPSPPGGSALLTVAEVAGVMRVSNMTVYRMIKGGEIAAVRIGHNYRIRESELERYLAERSVQVEGA